MDDASQRVSQPAEDDRDRGNESSFTSFACNVGDAGVASDPGESTTMAQDRPVQTQNREDMRHSKTTWVDDDFATEPLSRLIHEYVIHLEGRAGKTSAEANRKVQDYLV